MQPNPITNHQTPHPIRSSLQRLFEELGENPERDGLVETPARFEKQLRESLNGYSKDPKSAVKLFENNDYHDLIVVSTIHFSSLCEHHVLPFFGHVDIAYIPGEKILGLSKFARIVDIFSKRLQVQERLTQEIAEFLAEQLQPELVMVRISAVHTCMATRGVNRPASKTDTFAKIGPDTPANRAHVQHFRHTGETI